MKKPLVTIFIIIFIVLVASISTLFFLSKYKIVNIEENDREEMVKWFVNEENQIIIKNNIIKIFMQDLNRTNLLFPERKFIASDSSMVITNENSGTSYLFIKNPTNEEITVKAKVQTNYVNSIKNNTKDLFFLTDLVKNGEAKCIFSDTGNEISEEYRIPVNDFKAIPLQIWGKKSYNEDNKINIYGCNITIEGIEKENQKQLIFLVMSSKTQK